MVVSVLTIVEYFVLLLIALAVIGSQSHATSGYTCVPFTIEITTGASTGVSAGMLCAVTMQYLQSS